MIPYSRLITDKRSEDDVNGSSTTSIDAPRHTVCDREEDVEKIELLGQSSSRQQATTTFSSSWAVPFSDSVSHAQTEGAPHDTFNPSIEGLRGLAVCLTMSCHILRGKIFRLSAGSMGVTVFFVLSGFLITGVLIRLQKKSDSIFRRLSRFYTDRFVRLMPALVVMTGITYAWHSIEKHNMVENRRYALLSLSYLGNWRDLWPNRTYTGPWGNTWSLACEEQFYIIWSLALPFILKRSTRVRMVILGGITGYLIFLRVYTSMYAGSFFSTDWRYGLWANVWKMVAGSSLRLIPLPRWLMKRVGAYLGLLGLLATLLATLAPQPNYGRIAPGWKDPLGPIQAWVDILSVFFTCLILCGVSGSGGGIILLEGTLIRFLGRVSYAWYLWQVPLLTLSGWRKIYPAFADTALALVLATCSTLWIEEPLRKKFKSRQLGVGSHTSRDSATETFHIESAA